MKYRLLATVLIALCTSASVPVTWTVDVSRVAPVSLEAYHGETLSLTARLGVPVPAGSATFLWQTNGMGTAYWQRPATVSADGIVRGTFEPDMDTGADVVRFFFSVVSGGANYRASGTIRLRPSPGATPSTIDLPNAQSINFAEIDVINAPWLTAEETAEAIRSATNSAHAAAMNEIEAAQEQNALYYCTIEAAAAIARAATNHTDAAVAALQIPSLAGYATQEWVGQQGYLTQHQSLTNYATIAWVQSLYDGIEIPSLAGYATQAWVGQQGYLTQHQDLSGYSTTAYTASAIAAALSGYLTAAQASGMYASINQVAALLSGYATQQYVQDAVGGVQVPSLDGYATLEWVEGGLSNLSSRSDARYLQSVPPGYATEQYVQTAIDGIDIPDPSAYATRTEVAEIQANVSSELDAQRTLATAQADAAEARAKDYARNLSYASGVGNTRLVTEDGRTWQDATGTVWQVSDVWGWVGTAWTNGVSFSIAFKPVPDDELFGYPKWRTPDGVCTLRVQEAATGFGDWDITIEGHPTIYPADGDVALDATNLAWNSFSGLYGTLTNRMELYKAVVALQTNAVRQVAYTDTQGGGGGNASSSEEALRLVTPDGTKWMDASGMVYEVLSGFTPWVFSDGLTRDVETYDNVESSIYYIYGADSDSSPVTEFSTREERDNCTSFAYYIGQTRVEATRSYYASATTNYIGRVALTNDIPTTPSEVGAAPASVADTVQAWTTYWDGDDVRVTVTNYYGSEDHPHLYIEQKMPADDSHASPWFKTIWDEVTRHQPILQRISAVESELENKADRAWGFYDSHTGEYSPDGFTTISSSNIMIAAGMAYQKTVTTEGEVWVLTATEPTTISGVTTNGFFRISDGDGNSLFEIVKGDKRTVGATAGSISVSGNVIHITYDVVSDNPPTIWCTTDLNSGIWNEVPLIPATHPVGYIWSGASGHWVAELTSGGSPLPPRLFFKATYQLGSETYIKNSAPVGFERVYIGGRSYRVTVETVNGKKLMVLTDD